jgi:hypothetical protein
VHRIHVVLGYVVLFGLGALGIAWSIGGLVSGNAPLISRQKGTVSVADDPVYFWVSVVFHLLLGLFSDWRWSLRHLSAAQACGLTLRCTRPATAGFASLRRRVNSNVRPFKRCI